MFTILFLSYCFIFDILNRVFYIKASVNAENKFYALYFVAVLILVTFIVRNIVFTIRRLHDLNLNGWWCIWYGEFNNLAQHTAICDYERPR